MPKNNSLKKFCRLTKYIEKIDPMLHQVIEDLCMGYFFKPRRGSSGLTFLYPENKDYRQKIINAAYSTDPDIALNMMKSLILTEYYSDTTRFNDDVTNLLNLKLGVTDADEDVVKLTNGLTLSKDENFIPLRFDNMAVYRLKGKGELPTTGEVAKPKPPKKVKTGGGLSGKAKLQKFLENTYMSELDNKNNVYVKKVRLHLKLLREKGQSGYGFFLGNDEISDSYLLDMYCNKNCSGCFQTLYDALNDPKTANVSFDDYVREKALTTGSGFPNKSVTRSAADLRGLRTPIDVRSKVCSDYARNKTQLGRDLFIVFCNMSKDLWMTKSAFDRVDEFKEFAYIAANIYTKPEDLTNQEYNATRDLTLYGNLIKSDVYKFVPQADFSSTDSVDSSLKKVSEVPNPLDMTRYSLCYLVNHYARPTTGGRHDPDLDKLLTGL